MNNLITSIVISSAICSILYVLAKNNYDYFKKIKSSIIMVLLSLIYFPALWNLLLALIISDIRDKMESESNIPIDIIENYTINFDNIIILTITSFISILCVFYLPKVINKNN